MSLASKECKEPVKSVTTGLLGSWLYLFICAILLSVFNVLGKSKVRVCVRCPHVLTPRIVPPGAYSLARSGYPMVEVTYLRILLLVLS